LACRTHPDACRRILREHRDQNATIDAGDMREDMDELLAAYDAGIEELAMASAGMEAGSARVRAIKTRLALQRERFALLHEISGHPPISVLPQERDLQAVAQTVIDVLERHPRTLGDPYRANVRTGPATKRRWNRTIQAGGCPALPALKAGWATRPLPLRAQGYGSVRGRRLAKRRQPSRDPDAR
jgi:hypothetical protein